MCAFATRKHAAMLGGEKVKSLVEGMDIGALTYLLNER